MGKNDQEHDTRYKISEIFSVVIWKPDLEQWYEKRMENRGKIKEVWHQKLNIYKLFGRFWMKNFLKTTIFCSQGKFTTFCRKQIVRKQMIIFKSKIWHKNFGSCQKKRSWFFGETIFWICRAILFHILVVYVKQVLDARNNVLIFMFLLSYESS